MTYSFEDSKRIKALRRELVAAIPRFPNNKASKDALEKKHITNLLITYIAWRLRHVGMRPRKVVRGLLDADPRAAALQANIDHFLKAVERGDDLTPYLSLEPRTKGYSPDAEGKSPGANSWLDKDMLLNVMGLHHFHLGTTMETAGHALRTNELIFASVTCDEFEILGLFDHAAFENLTDGSMTPERKRIWAAYLARAQAQTLPGQLSIGGFAASEYPCRVIRSP
jgi:hypothetical protein